MNFSLNAMKKSYPNTRMRRIDLLNLLEIWLETSFSIDDLIYPIFILPGKNKEQPINSMPGKSRYSVDVLIKEIEKLHKNGLNAIALFPVIDSKKKSKMLKRHITKKAYANSS